ncbi:hypothetical protein, partial [Collinsella aerofaciens]|uniref:hypothetical protein n=1 Tax=Collinsella aerofaciens TaxID=74426 RepID=UPI00232C3E05
MGFANFSEEGRQPGGSLLDRFDMRGLIFFNVMGTLLLWPWRLQAYLWSAKITLPGPGCLLCFEKFAK